MKHTSGPWTAEYSANTIFIRDSKGCFISSLHRHEVANSVFVPNARLISAAPEAHELLLQINEFFRHWGSPDPSAMFDETRTFKQAVEEYLAKVSGDKP